MAKIAGARVAAAHDGVAELIVTLVYENSGTSEVSLDAWASAALMSSCDARDLIDLEGHDWQKVRDALGVSYNRVQPKGEEKDV